MRIRAAMSMAGLGLGLTLGAACRDGDQSDGRARVRSVDELAREGKFTLGDSHVVAALVTPKVPGRIIYDPPEDLSLANAMRMRPDLVKGDTTRRDTSHAATRRDTTGGDATVDTSGGAVRRKRP
jgi:hypothetical protein